MQKKLYRDMEHKMLAGVCAGVANYLGIDPTIVRVAWVILSLFAFLGVIAYILCALIIPQGPAGRIEG